MEFSELKKLIQQTFDLVADGYDCEALQFFSSSAAHQVRYLDPKPDEQLLDIATGTGNVALVAAKVQPGARVTGIDFAPNMLARARSKAQALGLNNVDFQQAEMPQLEGLPRDQFDGASCGFGIFFLQDMIESMSNIRDLLKPGGRLVVSSFYDESFSPLSELFCDRIESYGIEPPKQMWQRLCTEEMMTALFEDAGYQGTVAMVEDVSYYVKGVEQWWEILWNAGYRGLLNQLSESDLKQFKIDHLVEVATHVDGKGLKIQIKTLYGVGKRPH